MQKQNYCKFRSNIFLTFVISTVVAIGGCGFNEGYQVGESKGKEIGYQEGEKKGREAGYQSGYQVGESKGKEVGYNKGWTDGALIAFQPPLIAFSFGTVLGFSLLVFVSRDRWISSLENRSRIWRSYGIASVCGLTHGVLLSKDLHQIVVNSIDYIKVIRKERRSINKAGFKMVNYDLDSDQKLDSYRNSIIETAINIQKLQNSIQKIQDTIREIVASAKKQNLQISSELRDELERLAKVEIERKAELNSHKLELSKLCDKLNTIKISVAEIQCDQAVDALKTGDVGTKLQQILDTYNAYISIIGEHKKR